MRSVSALSVLSLHCLLSLASVAEAQQRAASPLAPVCPIGASPRIDTVTAPVVIQAGTAWNRHQFSNAERQRILFFADAIRQRFVPPTSLGDMPTVAEIPLRAYGGKHSPHSAVGGKLVLVVKPNGRLRDKFWQVQPMSAPFALAVAQAVIAADTSHDFDGIPSTDSLRQKDDTLVVQTRSAEVEVLPDELPLMRARLLSYRFDGLPLVIKKGKLEYPYGARRAGVDNTAEIQVFVGSDGRAVMASTQITRLEWRDFVPTLLRSTAETMYAPAQSAGCAVPSIAIEYFSFEIEKPSP
jgi:hypothetical protein